MFWAFTPASRVSNCGALPLSSKSMRKQTTSWQILLFPPHSLKSMSLPLSPPSPFTAISSPLSFGHITVHQDVYLATCINKSHSNSNTTNSCTCYVHIHYTSNNTDTAQLTHTHTQAQFPILKELRRLTDPKGAPSLSWMLPMDAYVIF